MKALFSHDQRAFSLLEIIIAITIIAIFTVLPVLAYTSYQKKARDEKRKSDLGKISQALESYKAEKGSYPPDLQTLVTSGFLPEVPKDPLEGQSVPWDQNGGTFGYSFSSPDGTTYTLSAKMEQGGGSGGSGSVAGSGSSAMTGGNITGTFTGTGSGTINSATVSINGIVTNNVFKGSFNGSVTGNGGLTGTVNGILNKPVTGTAQGTVTGTATITTGTVNGSSFIGTYTGFSVTGVANGTGGSSGGTGSICVSTPALPSCQILPVITLTIAAQASVTPNAPMATGYATPTIVGTITATPTKTMTLTPTNTPTNTPTPTFTPTNTPTFTPTPTPRYWARTMDRPYNNNTYPLYMYPKSTTSILGVGTRWNGSSYFAQLSDIAGSGILTQNRTYTGNGFTTGFSAYTPTSDGGAMVVTQAFGLAKLDSSFNLMWSKKMPLSLYVTSINEIPSVGYVVAAYNYSGTSMAIMKIDTAGNFIWEKDYSINWTGPFGSSINGVDAKAAYSSTSGKIVALYSWQENGGQIINYGTATEYTERETIIYKIVYDTNGNVLSSENLIGVGQYQYPDNYYYVVDNYASISLISTSDGGFAGLHPISVYDNTYANLNTRERFIKMDSNGTITNRVDIDLTQWSEWTDDLVQTTDGGYLIAMDKYKYNGNVSGTPPADGSDVILEKLTSAYAHSWTKTINMGGYENGYKVSQMSNGDILFSGNYAPGGSSNTYGLFIKMDSTGSITSCSNLSAGSANVNTPSATPTPGGGRATSTPSASGSPFYTQSNGSAKTITAVTLTLTNPTDTQGAFCTY